MEIKYNCRNKLLKICAIETFTSEHEARDVPKPNSQHRKTVATSDKCSNQLPFTDCYYLCNIHFSLLQKFVKNIPTSCYEPKCLSKALKPPKELLEPGAYNDNLTRQKEDSSSKSKINPNIGTKPKVIHGTQIRPYYSNYLKTDFLRLQKCTIIRGCSVRI